MPAIYAIFCAALHCSISLIISCAVVDLGRMYSLVSRIPDGLGELRTLLENHICNQGLNAIEKCGDQAFNVSKLKLTLIDELTIIK